MELTESTNYQVSITKEELSMLPLATFDSPIVVVDKSSDVESAIEEIRKFPIIGFDTETKPSFSKGTRNKVSLVQISTDSNCYLFRLNKIGFKSELIKLLEDPKIIKIGLSIRDDFLNLKKLKNIKPDGFIDLQQYVKQFKIMDNSLQRIYAILFGERISKGQRMTNWEAPTLTQSQLNYAAFDAFACVKIYKYLKSGYFNPEQSDYFRKIVIIEDNLNNEFENNGKTEKIN